MKRAALLIVLGIALPLGPQDALANDAATVHTDIEANFELGQKLELQAVKRTQGLLDDKYSARKAEMSRRVRAMYKLSRASWPRIWFEPEIRQSASRWLGAARRITKRDIAELAMLKNEMAITERDDKRLRSRGAADLGDSTSISLRWPIEDSKVVSSFGDYGGPSRRVRLRRRGVLLKAAPGAIVVAPAAGRVRYAGTISGLGESLIIEHGPASAPTGLSVLGRLATSQVKRGATLEEGQSVASAANEEVYLEFRVGTLAKSVPVDPAAMLHK